MNLPGEPLANSFDVNHYQKNSLLRSVYHENKN